MSTIAGITFQRPKQHGQECSIAAWHPLIKEYFWSQHERA